jgi:ankyrin repeat protein
MYGYPLEAAAHYGNEEVVRMLLHAGANVNAQGGYYGNALQAAARYGRVNLVRILLGAGADVNAQGRVHDTALESATQRGHDEVTKILLAAGADKAAKDEICPLLQLWQSCGRKGPRTITGLAAIHLERAMLCLIHHCTIFHRCKNDLDTFFSEWQYCRLNSRGNYGIFAHSQ